MNKELHSMSNIQIRIYPEQILINHHRLENNDKPPWVHLYYTRINLQIKRHGSVSRKVYYTICI